MLRAPRLLAAAVLLLLPICAFAAADPTYTELRNARPDGRTIALSNFVFTDDAFRFTLTGTLHLLAPVAGKTPGAVFLGQGSYELTPASVAEQRQLALNAGDEKLTALTDTFDSAVFLGTALPAAAEKTSAPVAGAANATATDRWNDYLKKQRKDFHANVHIDVLRDLLDSASRPFFLVWLNGKKYPPALLSVDPHDIEPASMSVLSDTKGGVWYSSAPASVVRTGVLPGKEMLVDPQHYLVDATIRGAELSSTSTMTFLSLANVRVLPINLFGKLRIAAAEFAPAGENPSFAPVPFIQEDEDEDPNAAVVFPQPLKQGETYLLRIRYAGKDALQNAGDGNFSVGARTSWYPNVAVFDDLADYELHFRTPQKFQIVATGTEVDAHDEGTDRVATWKTTAPIRVAGFNYGKFKKLEQTDKDSGMTVAVFTNPGTPDILREINAALAAANDVDGIMSTGPTHLKVDTASLAQSALVDGMNTARTGNALFGPLAVKKVAITQQSEWAFGQSWPSLIYLPYLAFISGTARNTLGINSAKDFVDVVGPHEFAHQWWGHQVGWATYRDQWLSEGFAEFTAAVVLQQTGGQKKYDDFWERARRRILEKPRGAVITNDAAGPITQGWRLGTWQNPDAYSAIVYEKGAYVLHMLRMAMQDRKTGDQEFIAMMKEFASTYAGKNPTTRDFLQIATKHATPNLRITNDQKMDWFFNQWVYGTAIPRFDSKFNIKDLGGGKYKVTGTVTQSEVPPNFASVVPVYVYFDKNAFVRLGAVTVIGSTTSPIDFEIALPKKPQKFAVNVLHDILAR
ncbi:MAG: hypothetical protein JO197_18795 [Acidobacteria bacterium]|nr:hypothetical protein [Acidobacteriota bacterium]MBV9477145.1 hypothetical protein [Acidobacteriota bacterium]